VALVRIGSRGSQLALWQANHIKALLEARGHTIEIEIIKTTGDKITDVALAQVGTKGMFTKEIEEVLAENRIDLAVHSLKDLPTELSPGFEIAAILTREDARDAFCSQKYHSIEELPKSARVGTSSLRRQAQLKAVILAVAGLNRLGKTECVRQLLPASVMCPAAGQGALAIEIRKNDSHIRQHVAFLDDNRARASTTCERALLNEMGGGCQVPIGAFAEVIDGRLHLEAIVARPDGTKVLRESGEGDSPQQLGETVGEALLRRGGDVILRQVYGKTVASPEQP
jgi:hydroxymethylbilane synthase